MFELSEENFKKNKINWEIVSEHAKVKKFDKTKLKITVTQLVLPDSSEIKAITEISYDKQDISWDLIESNVEATGDLPNLEVNKI